MGRRSKIVFPLLSLQGSYRWYGLKIALTHLWQIEHNTGQNADIFLTT
jgi:hypothetical protein